MNELIIQISYLINKYANRTIISFDGYLEEAFYISYKDGQYNIYHCERGNKEEEFSFDDDNILEGIKYLIDSTVWDENIKKYLT